MTEPPSEVLADLSPGQAEAVWAIYRWYHEQPAQEFFLAGEAGTGKTTIAARLVRGMGLRTAVAAYTGKAASVLRKKGLWQAGTIHSLIYTREPGTEPPRWVRNPESALADARLLALDECFVKSSMLDTAIGRIMISCVRPGDLILNANGTDRVVAVSRKRAKTVAQVNTGGSSFACSEDHLFFTCRGLVSARDLRLGDRLAPTRTAMRLLRESFYTSQLDWTTLQRELRRAMEPQVSRDSCQDVHRRTRDEGNRGSSPVVIQPRGRESPTVAEERCVEAGNATRSSREDSSFHESAWSLSTDTDWWKRQDDAHRAESALGSPWSDRLADRVRSFDKTTSSRFANLLQDRHRELSDEDRDRGRRPLALLERSARTRHEEDRFLDWPRVESVEVLESGDPRLDHERDADGELYLYDLQAERHHSFSVEGVLVHNCSMCDYSIAEDLRAYGRKILVLGDLEQLPPIQGQGAFTARPPDYTLTEVHRQAAESPVLRLAGAARRGTRLEDTLAEGDDRARIIRLGRRELLEAAERGAQVICGVHRSRWGATKIIREHFGFRSGFPESGDRVICRRNDRELGIYNGMLGTVLEVYDADNWRVNFRVRMDDTGEELDVWSDATLFREHTEGKLKPPLYQREVQLFDFGFVITCHSAQGSEWDEVVIIDDSQRFGDEARRWLYTAITRAAERVTLLRRGE